MPRRIEVPASERSEDKPITEKALVELFGGLATKHALMDIVQDDIDDNIEEIRSFVRKIKDGSTITVRAFRPSETISLSFRGGKRDIQHVEEFSGVVSHISLARPLCLLVESTDNLEAQISFERSPNKSLRDNVAYRITKVIPPQKETK